MRDIDNTDDIDLKSYKVDAVDHEYVDELSKIESTDAEQLLDVGVDTSEIDRSGTFIQKDKSSNY